MQQQSDMGAALRVAAETAPQAKGEATPDTSKSACANAPKQEGPRSVAQGFSEFAERLIPKYSESEGGEATLNEIERQLSAAFDMAYLAPYGSRGHGTHVAGYSAVDSFAVIPKPKLFKNSGKSLGKMKDVLTEILPEAFVTDGRPVVAVPFGDQRSRRHHVVPAYEAGERNGHDVFGVPAPRDRWIEICPGGHSVWINEMDVELNKNLKPFVRIIKAWSYFNGDVIWPYYLELCAADFMKKDSSVVYALDLTNFFTYMVSRQLQPFENAAGCLEPVYGTSIAGKAEAMEALRASAQMAYKARECEQRDNIADAFYWWRKIFNWQFSAY